MFPSTLDEKERMVALKKAFAEMILNTSKEASARVMAAERKAQKFEQDLLFTKEEALRMLLRMKQLIDAKSSEAEITSSKQKRRINELEAQLDEAEGLIIDLRAKLSQVQDQLDDVKSKYVHSLRQSEMVVMPSQSTIYENDQTHFAPFKSFSELESEALTSEMLASTSDHSILDHECFQSAKETARANTDFDHFPVQKPGFASVTTKSRGLDLFKNGCSQRVRAIETGLVDVKLHSADEVISRLENISTNRRKEQNEMNESMPVSRTDRLGKLDICVEQAALLNEKTADGQPVKLRKMHRRRTRYGKTKATSCKYRSDQIMKPRRKTFAISHCKSHSHSSSDVQRPGCFSTSTRNINEVDYTCALGEKARLPKHQTVSVIRRSARKRKVKHWDGFATSCQLNDSHSDPYDKPCYTDKTVKCYKKASKGLLEVEDGAELDKGICIRAASAGVTTCMNSGEGFTFLGDAAEKDTRMIDISTSKKLDGLASEFELEKVLLVLSDSRDIKTSEMTDKAHSQADSKTPIKYTFSRKCKKGALNNIAENNSFRQSHIKKRSGEETDNVLALESNNCVNESIHGW